MTGKLILCGTPIGNLEDLAPRGVQTLRAADVIACEDTRHTRKLLTHFGISPRKLVAHHEHNERRAAQSLLEEIRSGSTVVLVSDAGMPGISDPGFHLVRSAAAAGLPIEVVPGPSALVTAVAVSGLPAGRFVFEGFLPRKTSERRRHIADLVSETRTLVLYESPHRLTAALEDLLDVLGDRPAVVARELTKLHEEVRRGSLSSLLDVQRNDAARGEVVVVIQGAVHDHRPEPDAADLAHAARRLMAEGVPRREALRTVADEAGVAKRKVFDALVDDSQATGDAAPTEPTEPTDGSGETLVEGPSGGNDA